MTRRTRFIVLLTILLAAGVARAAKQGDAQTFAPSPHGLDLLQVEGARVNHGWDVPGILNAWALFNYAGEPLGTADDALTAIGTLDVLVAGALLDRLSLGLDLPLHLFQSGAAPGLQGGFSVGDLRLGLKGIALRPRKYGVGLAVSFDAILPTGAEDTFTAERGLALMPKLILEGVTAGARVALNVGLLKRFDEDAAGDVPDELVTRLGLGVPLGGPLITLITEATLASRLDRFYDDASTRLELDGGARLRLESGITVTLGGGAGLLEGFGDPSYRGFFGVGYQPARFRKLPPKDADGDGYYDPCDGCPQQAEDRDGFEDADGCPDSDNDKDGIHDGNDTCPMKPEDRDGFEDQDGCPEADNDRDGLLDGVDRCPLDPEDKDQFQDEDGCPDVDNDRDGMLDTSDVCPMEPETLNGYEDEDGCPDKLPMVYMTREKIVITQKIFFKRASDVIMKKSFAVLEAVARILAEHPEILLIRIEGHTSTEGSAKYNERLSDKRAKAIVRFLEENGIAAERLEAKGYGPARPLIDPEETEEDREKNRRVEFTILNQK